MVSVNTYHDVLETVLKVRCWNVVVVDVFQDDSEVSQEYSQELHRVVQL